MSVYRFENPLAFQWLWVLPVVFFLSLVFFRWHRKKIEKVISSKLLPFLTASISLSKRKLKLVLELSSVFFVVIAFARPQAGESRQKVKSEGIELVLLFDVSKSMLSEDVKPSRLKLATKEMIRFLELGGGDRMGVIAFAGSGIMLSPMTNDKAALRMYIESLSTDSVSTQGTEFKSALLAAKEAFENGGAEEDDSTVVTKAVVIVSDGEDNEPGAMQVAEQLAQSGVKIFTLGVGTERGGPIPVRDNRGNLRGYLKDKNRKVVMSKTRGTVLRELAKKGQGSFYHLRFGSDVVKRLKEDLRQLEQSEFASAEVTNYAELYQTFLLLGLFLALVELLLGERKSGGRIWKGRFEVAQD